MGAYDEKQIIQMLVDILENVVYMYKPLDYGWWLVRRDCLNKARAWLKQGEAV